MCSSDLATIPPFPTFEGDPSTFNIIQDMSQVTFGRPIMMFTCFFVPVGGDARLDKFKRNFVFFSAFEDLELDSEAGSPMQRMSDIKMLYEPGPWDPERPSVLEPVLYVAPLENILCRVPLTPLFLDGNSKNTIPYSKRSESSKYPNGRHDSAPGSGNGSLVYEVNTAIWRFGRAKKRTMSVAEAEQRRAERQAQGRRQAHETRRRNRSSQDE